MNKVYVGNVQPGTTRSDLERRFKPYGGIEEILLFTDKYFAFIVFEEPESAQLAVEHGGGGTLKVEIAGQRPPRKKIERDDFTPDHGEGGQRQPSRANCRKLWK